MNADIREKMKLILGRISGLVALFEHSTWRKKNVETVWVLERSCSIGDHVFGAIDRTFNLAACAYIVD